LWDTRLVHYYTNEFLRKQLTFTDILDIFLKIEQIEKSNEITWKRVNIKVYFTKVYVTQMGRLSCMLYHLPKIYADRRVERSPFDWSTQNIQRHAVLTIIPKFIYETFNHTTLTACPSCFKNSPALCIRDSSLRINGPYLSQNV
jgi:hypothetical protein